jgi:hypothetical protein
MNIRALALALTLFALPAEAQQTEYIGNAVAELQAGVICAAKVVGTSPAPDTVAGVSNIIEEDPPFVTDGRVVPAVIGVGFAIKARTVTDMNDLLVVVTHPPMGPEGMTRESFPSSLTSLELSMNAWQFEYDYELVTGPWTFSVFDGNKLIYRVPFEVVPPDMLPELAGVCGYEALLS